MKTENNNVPATVGGMVSWVLEMRKAAQQAIKTEDVEAIVRAQIEQAKKPGRDGKEARDFLFTQILGGDALPRNLSITQNNFAADAADPSAPLNPAVAKPDRVKVMQKRLAMGLPLTSPEDGGSNVNLD